MREKQSFTTAIRIHKMDPSRQITMSHKLLLLQRETQPSFLMVSQHPRYRSGKLNNRIRSHLYLSLYRAFSRGVAKFRLWQFPCLYPRITRRHRHLMRLTSPLILRTSCRQWLKLILSSVIVKLHHFKIHIMYLSPYNFDDKELKQF